MNITDSNTHCCRGRSAMHKWLIGYKLRKLNLDHDQVEKFEELLDRARLANQQCDNTKSEVQECIGAILTNDDFTLDKAAALIRAATEQYATRAVEIVAELAEFYRGLEPEQQLQLQSLWRKRPHRASRCCH